jgi:3-hydroxybutyryl-CoA dehydrogenase
MGTGLAQRLASYGHEVILLDLTEQILDKAREQIYENTRLTKLLKKSHPHLPDREPAEVLNKICFTVRDEDLSGAVYVIENVTEDWETKRPVYEKVDAICPPEAIFAVNTSAIAITQVASVTKRPSNIIGIHFMNPVPLKTTVEVIKGVHTSQETIDRTISMLGSIGKDYVIVNDSPGFISNRVLMLTINEAIFALHENVADVEGIDKIFKSCFGHAMGPLETADLIGLDTIYNTLLVLVDSFRDPKFRPSPLLKRMVDAGFHGKKSGRGFYNY